LLSTVETVNALVTALQSGDLELAASLLSEDCVVSGFAPEPLKRAKFLALQSQLLAAMPDFSYNLSQIDAEGKNAHALITITGTNTNNLELPEFGLQSIPATGLQIVLPQVPCSWRVRHEAVVKIDMEEVPGGGLTGLLQQIGAELPIAPRVGEIDQRNLTS
jgi:hypothetical protein